MATVCTWLQRIAPSRAVTASRLVVRCLLQGNPWRGVYATFREVPRSGEGFDGSEWLDGTRCLTRRTIAVAHGSRGVPSETVGEHSLLPLVIAVAARERGRVRVLDFGGGMGIDYAHLMASLPAWRDVEYVVVDRPDACVAGARLYGESHRIRFLPELPESLNVDIVHVNAALHYQEDYRAVVTSLCSYGARYALLVNHFVGEFPTFATAQRNVRGTTIPAWFFGLADLQGLFAGLGYSLVAKTALEREFDQRSLPADRRAQHACNLLFARDEAS